LSHKEILNTKQGYKYPVIHCSFDVDDAQEIQKRGRDLLMGHPYDHAFSDKWDPPGSPFANSSDSLTLAYPLNLTQPEQRLSINPTRKS
jgi:hypothetical protein